MLEFGYGLLIIRVGTNALIRRSTSNIVVLIGA